MTGWTPSMVEERLAEAAAVLKCLPEPRRQGYFNTWPAYFYEFADLVGQVPAPIRLAPSPAAIGRMEQTLTWTMGLEPIDGKIVWMKAYGWRWKIICRNVGLQRSAANEHWLYGLCLITLKLNQQRFNRNLSRRKVIKLVCAS
ncbi:hypothetical protein KUG47_15280 [Falsochrobactrum sp. TDYN1]|uniref:DUF6362 domain-containing protein n=1 Tax=Falsochrobactrum tianjinense TaxID=2706015 RepID=A0A949PNZ2_9HYPH|nr:DUF6362 family protein [Falsochrobactrum sp. TDYN1]MBV2144861.1 hypothetical protein [Falsochrobactrum sp. TDYN1]